MNRRARTSSMPPLVSSVAERDGAAAAADLGELAVQQDPHARLVRHLVQHHLQDLGVVFDPVHAMAGRHDEMAVAAAAAHGLEAAHDLLGEARDHAAAGAGFPADELADGARRRGAAQEAVALEQHGARTLAGGGDGGHGARHAAAAGQNVAIDGIHFCSPESDHTPAQGRTGGIGVSERMTRRASAWRNGRAVACSAARRPRS